MLGRISTYLGFSPLRTGRSTTLWLIVLAAVLLAALLFPTRALGQSDIWLGGAGNWSDSGSWSAGVPTSTSIVFIDNGNPKKSVVTVNGGYSCNSLTLDANDSLNVPGGGALAIYGTSIANSGQIVVDDASGFASLDIATGQNVALTGTGTVMLSDTTGSAGAFINGVSNSTLTNVSNTIEGSGQIGQGGGLILVNQSSGVINANQTGHTLYINAPGGTTNSGMMEATGGGLMTFAQTLTVNNAGGTISATGSGSTVLMIGITQ